MPAFSNSGANLDLVAPGVDIWMPTIGGGWVANSGTSFSSPLVAGVAALLRAHNPGITQLEVKKWLTGHTKDSLDPARDGAGLLHYQLPSDWSDVAGYPPADHANSLWEWLGTEVAHEVSDTDPQDTDGVPNRNPIAPQAKDLGDDAVFLINLGKPPFAPTR